MNITINLGSYFLFPKINYFSARIKPFLNIHFYKNIGTGRNLIVKADIVFARVFFTYDSF